jgi:hypothetical protein
MSGFMLMLYIFLQKYLVPFLFSIGLFYFIYGIVEYFIIGKGGDEGRMQNGRGLFLKAIAWFVIAMIVHVFVLAIGWISTIGTFSPSTPRGDADVEIRENPNVLEVPNVPTR